MISMSWKSLLKKDAPYNLDLIKAERERIDRHLKEVGYYYFTSDYIIVRVDSTVGDNKVDMFVSGGMKDHLGAIGLEDVAHTRLITDVGYQRHELNSIDLG